MSLILFVLVLLTAALHAGWNYAAKKVAGNLSVLWLGICLGSVISWPYAIAVFRSVEMVPHVIAAILATGILHACYFGLLAKAYADGDISLVYPVARGTGVAGTALVAFAWLDEPLSANGGLGIGAVCLGTMVLGLGQYRQHTGLSYVYALLVGATIIGYSVVDKLAVGTMHPVSYISSMFTLCALLLAPHQLGTQRAACRHALRHLKTSIAIVGLGSIATYAIILCTFRLGPVSYIVATREFAVVIGALLGVYCLQERLTARKVVGIVAIVGGLILIKLR
jgi:drug/metabolite transporter (DMT)-like permease